MKQWIKFSTGIHKDRKMWKLSKDAQLVFFYLLSIAGNDDKNGELPSAEDIGLELWFLKFSGKCLNRILEELKNSEILEISTDGKIRLKNFEKWQVSEKTKSEINREYYLKSKKSKSEIQKDSENFQSEIKTEFSLNSENGESEIQKNSAEIKTLEKEIEIDKEKEKEKDIYILAADAAKEVLPQSEKKAKEKKTSNPDDDAFWNVFKHKKDLAIAFYKATGLYPMSKEFGHWQKDLDDFIEAGITVDIMEKAIRKIKADGKIQYKTPGSVLSTARFLMAQKSQETAMTTEDVMNNANTFKSAADMLRALATSKQSEVIDL